MNFRMSHQTERQKVPSGERFKQDYVMQYDKNGHKYLEKSKLVDLQEIIQKDLESVKFQNIIARCVDPMELCGKNKGVLDITQMPTTLMEAHNMILNATQYFDQLPAKVKQMYGNSAERFIADAGTDGAIWRQAVAEYNKPKQQPTTHEGGNEE